MDKTMDGWSRKLFYLGIAVLMALGLLLAPATTTPQASAAGVDSKWQKVATPNMDDWFVAPGFNAYDYAVDDEDSVIYVVGDLWMDNDSSGGVNNRFEVNPKLLKSVDGGATWKDISKAVNNTLKTDIVNYTYSYTQVAVAPDNPDFVALSVWRTSDNCSKVLYSSDGGKKFKDTGDLDGGNYSVPLDISVSPLYGDNMRNIALIGASNMSISSGTGMVERLLFSDEAMTGKWMNAISPSETPPAWNWSSCEIVTSIAWSPNFAQDSTVLVVTYDSTTCSLLQHGVWPSSEDEDVYWNEGIGNGIKPRGSNITCAAAPNISFGDAIRWRLTSGIALPSDYNGNSKSSWRALVYVDNSTFGNIFSVDESTGNMPADPVKKQINGAPILASLTYSGDIASGKAVAGTWGNETQDNITSLEAPCPCGSNPGGIQVYHNGNFIDMDTESKWLPANDYKLPTGIGPAVVSYATAAGDKLYALTSGLPWWWWRQGQNDTVDNFFTFSEGALSVSFNDGESCSQIGLINTDIGHLTDVAAAPDCNTTLLVSNPHTVTWNNNPGGNCSSVWLKCEALPEYASEYNGRWMRVWSGCLATGLLRLVPDETTEVSNVYLVERLTRTLYHTESKGLDDWTMFTKAPANFFMTDVAAKSPDAVYAASDDSRVAMFDGSTWPSAHRVDSGLKDSLNTIAVSGDSVLVGDIDGDVAYSSDGGLSFTELKDGLPEEGCVFVAFDSYFDTNKVVYAAVAGYDIYRWTIGESDEWDEMHACDFFGTDYGVNYTGIVTERAGNPMTSATTGGVLYAAYFGYYYNATTYSNQSGILRCMNPAADVCCGMESWDNVYAGLTRNETFNREPTSLKICGCLSPDTNSKLFAIDNGTPYYNSTVCEVMNDNKTVRDTYGKVSDLNMGRLWTFQDCFAKASPVLTAPEDAAVLASDPCNCWNDAFTLKWDRQCDACYYNVQISLDPDFTELVEPAYGGGWGTDEPIRPEEGATPSLVVLNRGLGDGSCGTTYYWRVRVCHAETEQNIRSPWSEARTFTIGAGPEARVKLTSPSEGAIVSPANIEFTWDAVPDATGYVFSLKDSVAGTDVVGATDVAGTTYTYIGTLSYDTPYLWTVKAMKGEVVFGQATATFRTKSAPAEVPPPSTPAYVWVIIAIGAVLVIVTLVLIFRTRRV